jgi:glycosyltransferase involved in cell wall biosynthesis
VSQFLIFNLVLKGCNQLMSRPQIGMIYLGKRGAAESHLLLLRQLAGTKVDLKVVLSSQNQKLQEYQNLDADLLVLDLPIDIKGFVRFIFGKDFRSRIVNFFIETRLVYFYIPHPLDNSIARSLLKSGTTVLRSIHDDKCRPGDKWPTRLSLIRQIRYSSGIVTHSSYVAQKISSRVNSRVIPLPTPRRLMKRRSDTKIVLFVGRFRKYKGIHKLLKAWPKVLESVPNATLIVAGDGESYSFPDLPNTLFINKWLKSEEIEELIDSSTCVVFPYREASQSGPLSLAISAAKPVVVTDVGGLLEQAANGIYFKVDYLSESISSGIVAALGSESPISRETCENRELADFLVEKSIFRR